MYLVDPCHAGKESLGLFHGLPEGGLTPVMQGRNLPIYGRIFNLSRLTPVMQGRNR